MGRNTIKITNNITPTELNTDRSAANYNHITPDVVKRCIVSGINPIITIPFLFASGLFRSGIFIFQVLSSNSNSMDIHFVKA